ncbi:hypothetical protein [Oerskovia paurometabola]|uniref:hypothetical protein n=1 Tax=Oerskovia paurometabola TaxID=162170 RepID=UPI00382D87E6
MRDHRTPRVIAVALGTALTAVLSPAATALPHDISPVTSANDTTDPDVVLPWDGETPRSIAVSGELWGQIVVVPGDSGRASVTVRNDGPTTGTLTASIVDVTVHRDTDDPAWIDDRFYDDLTIDGTPVTALEGRATEFLSVDLPPGATTEVPLLYGFEGWTGNRTGGGLDGDTGLTVNPGGVGEREVTFDVLLRIGGGPDDADETTTGGDGDAASRPGAVGPLMATGGAALAGTPWALLGAAALLALVGAAARARDRRRSGRTT